MRVKARTACRPPPHASAGTSSPASLPPMPICLPSDGGWRAPAHTGLMTHPNQESKPVPVSSGRNRFASTRTLIVAAVVGLFLIVAVFVPW